VPDFRRVFMDNFIENLRNGALWVRKALFGDFEEDYPE
jgi:hypothetical protein